MENSVTGFSFDRKQFYVIKFIFFKTWDEKKNEFNNLKLFFITKKLIREVPNILCGKQVFFSFFFFHFFLMCNWQLTLKRYPNIGRKLTKSKGQVSNKMWKLWRKMRLYRDKMLNVVIERLFLTNHTSTILTEFICINLWLE